jgi:hypothetical protein
LFENRVLRKIYGAKRDEVTRYWNRLHNEQFHYLYSSPVHIRVTKSRTRWAGHVGRMRERRGAYRILLEKPDGKR